MDTMMRMHRIYTDQALQGGQTVTLTDEEAHYLSRVLRVTIGQSVILFNGDGSDYLAEIHRVERTAIRLELSDRLPACAESPLHITLVQAISRGERMDLSLQKATELGVAALQPVFTARTEVRLSADKLERRMEHWHKVIISACEQSGRSCLPALHRPIALTAWAQQDSQASRVMLTPGASGSLTRMAPGLAVELLVGPEGGFDERELEFLHRHGVLAVSLGPRILRTETAGPAAIAIMQALAGDMAV
jgi:16S rRNA (uracil1498-N3)-methyltransferase